MSGLTLQTETARGARNRETEWEKPARERKERREGWNFQTAGLTRTPKDSWKPVVRRVMMSPTRSRTQPQPPSG